MLSQRVGFDEEKRRIRGLEDHRVMGICVSHVPDFDQCGRAPMGARAWNFNVRLRLSKVWPHEFRAIGSANWRLVPFGFMVTSARSYHGQASRHPKLLDFVLVGLEHGPRICCPISSLLICMMIDGVSTIEFLAIESEWQVLISQDGILQSDLNALCMDSTRLL